MTKIVTTTELNALLAGDKPVIVDFFATWCAPCKAMSPVVDAVTELLESRAEVVKVDIDESFELASKYGVRSVPTFIAFRGGHPASTKTGTIPRQLFIDWARAQAGVTV